MILGGPRSLELPCILFQMFKNNVHTTSIYGHCLFQPQTRDDIGIKEETRQIKCESSPPTPRSLRLERVAQALAASSEELQHRSVIAQPAFIRYATQSSLCFTLNSSVFYTHWLLPGRSRGPRECIFWTGCLENYFDLGRVSHHIVVSTSHIAFLKWNSSNLNFYGQTRNRTPNSYLVKSV